MTIAILATGDEIIHGDVLNTNGHTIAHALSSEGLPLGLHVSCSDKEQDIFSCLDFLGQQHDIIILIGGLGPTSDDRTRYALARYLKTVLVEFPDALAHIQTRLIHASHALTSGNRQQALFPADANLLPNPNGTAMGCSYQAQNKLFIMLPGPPRECLPMFNEHVLPLLQQTEHSNKQWYKWQLFGVSEGAISAILDDALAKVDCETGYRWDMPYLEFKVRCVDSEIAHVKKVVEPLLQPHIITEEGQKASENLRQRLEQVREPMVILDDATGGLLQTLIQRPSNQHWVSFHDNNTSKMRFHIKGLDAYWSQQSPKPATTQVTIEYHYGAEKGSETHQIPYFSALVIHYAAEWSSFRLFHLIDQLHKRIT